MADKKSRVQEELEYPHWNRVYLAVMIWTVIVIVSLWMFSRAF